MVPGSFLKIDFVIFRGYFIIQINCFIVYFYILEKVNGDFPSTKNLLKIGMLVKLVYKIKILIKNKSVGKNWKLIQGYAYKYGWARMYFNCD
mgnify:CR=1 FL=1